MRPFAALLVACIGLAPSAPGQTSSKARDDKSGAPDYTKGVDRDNLNAAGSSLKNLDTIRDRNLRMVQEDGCPPEVSARIGDLKWKIEVIRNGDKPKTGSVPDKRTSAASAKTATAGYQEVAGEWFKGGDAEPDKVASNSADSLDSVLPKSTVTTAKPETKITPAEIESLEAEIKLLRSGCAAHK